MQFKSPIPPMHRLENSVTAAEPEGGASGFYRDALAGGPETRDGGASSAHSHAHTDTRATPSHLRSPKYRPDIDGLRAIAVLSVLAFHAFPSIVRGGYVGVDLFFVISGYLISTIIFESLEKDRFTYREFYARRIRRIFPALVTVLSACLITGWFTLMPDEYWKLGKHVFSGAGFVSNIALWRESGYFDNTAPTKPLLHLWSLGIEEQFYIFWPLLLGFAWKRRLGFLTLTGIIAAASFAINMLTAKADPTAAFYSPFSRFWELMIGGMLAWLILHKRDVFPENGNWLSAAGLLLIGIAVVCFDKNDIFPGWRALLPTVGAFLIIAAGPKAWINRTLLANRLPVAIGLISYPLYLWHWPLLSMANIVEGGLVTNGTKALLLVVAFALATATYRLVELPLRTRGNSRVKIGALCVMLAALAATGVFVFKRDGLPSRPVAQSPGQAQAMLDVSIRAQYPAEPCRLSNARIDAMCSAYNSKSTGKLMVVWGDSHAGAWMPVFFKLAHDRDLRVMVISHIGCPPLLQTRRSDGAESAKECPVLGLAEQVVASLQGLDPSVIFLVSRWSLYGNGWISEGELQKATHFVTTDPQSDATQATSRAALASQIPLTVNRLLTLAPEVVVVQNPPLLKGELLPRSYDDPARVERSARDNASFESFNRGVIDQLSAMKGVRLFDPSAKLCDVKCAAVLNSVPVYHDDNHVSAQGALLFEKDIASFL
jgi:peptidoglycan/LPS O-acetylase OafA/YrhL